VYSFTNGADGGFPYAGLTLDADSNLYGEALDGGSFNSGILFKITPQDVFTPLHRITNDIDGANPIGGLALGTDGNFYGTAENFGFSKNESIAAGTVFRMTPTGTVTNLYTFTNGYDGGTPEGGLTLGGDGNFYGTTTSGGVPYTVNPPPTNLLGTIFKITPAGVLTPLHRFTNGVDGTASVCKLVEVAEGTFYGTATGDKTNHHGTIYSITSGGTFTPLYLFTNGIDGDAPVAGLALGPDGNLYGTASTGGANGFGTIFEFSTNEIFTVLYSFTGTGDGAVPIAPLLPGTNGVFYGTTSQGGLADSGTIFELVLSELTPPRFTTIVPGPASMTLRWTTVPDQTYQLQYTPALSPTAWSNLGLPTAGTGGLASYTNSTTGIPQRFYRILTYTP
jgi:uncharacterized repeat protein (TIGR03803 family)